MKFHYKVVEIPALKIRLLIRQSIGLMKASPIGEDIWSSLLLNKKTLNVASV